jgi:hypothetical protein
MFDWMSNIFSTPPLGSGLGIMSNGSNTFSDYADSFRETIWTETDFASTLFEGGIYLVVIWYSLRIYVVYQTTRRYLANVEGELSIPAAFCQGFVITAGVTATLGIQPPIAIWWWFSVGTAVLFWWKCIEPRRNEQGEVINPLPQKKKIQGQSPYARRLHNRRK